MANLASVSLTGLALLVSLALLFQAAQGAMVGLSTSDDGGGRRTRLSGYVPVRTVVYRSAALPATAEPAFEPFELCLACRCCPPAAAANSSGCVNTMCCFGINCNIPGKPFGFCAFTPRNCDCGPNNCTSAPTPPS